MYHRHNVGLKAKGAYKRPRKTINANPPGPLSKNAWVDSADLVFEQINHGLVAKAGQRYLNFCDVASDINLLLNALKAL